ncbi:MAG: hypothetical protein FK734_00605 [Asgard group archaeon]|nr:hypothetical protein [Asgard group archaeon]
MKGWQMNLIEGLTFLTIGLIIIAYNFLNNESINFFHNGYQINASLNPIFVVLLIIGFFFIGAGIAQAAVSSTIYKLEEKIAGNKRLTIEKDD